MRRVSNWGKKRRISRLRFLDILVVLSSYLEFLEFLLIIMKRSRPERSRATDETDTPWDDVYGIVLLMMAAMYFLALLSYDPGDLPAWAPLVLTDQSNEVTHNFIGQVGAIVAGVSFILMGLAAYLIPISLTWLGVCKIASHTKITRLTWAGVAIMVVTGSALLAANHLFDWHDEHLPHGGGGGLGRLVGDTLLVSLLGRVGATLVLGLAYGFGLFLVTKLHPVKLLDELRQEIPRWIQLMRSHYAVAGGVGAMMDEPLVEERAAVARAKRKRKVVAAEEQEEGAEVPDLPLSNLELPLKFEPAPPKIIDSSERRAHGAEDDKPRLAEVWGKKRAQKIEQAPHGSLGNLTVRFKDYVLPELDLLNWPAEDVKPADKGELLAVQNTIVRTLGSFGITVEPGDITRGPAITRYEVRPADGLRVSRIANLDADLARATRAERINILAPIPGKDTVGIELANRDKVIVPLRELLEDEIFQNGKAKIPVALGKDVYGKTIIGDLAAMPHLLVAGATGSGKSVCINGIITSLLCRFAPDELRFIMIDPKVVEMQTYEELPHLALPVVTDPKKALLALRWVVKEMENRYQIFAQEGCRNFETFNNRNRKRAEKAATAKAAKAAADALLPQVPEPVVEDELMDEPPFAVDGVDSPPLIEEIDGEEVQRIGHDWSSDATPPPPRRQELVIPDTLPYIVVIIDELADLMQTAPADIEGAIARITQMARAAGIHLIVATQTPRADVITGVIKANIPTRIAFQVASALDSRVILDRKGAENLVGKGDMLYVPPGGAQPIRSQGALVTDDEIHALVERCVAQGKPIFDVKVDDNTGDFGDEGESEGMDSEEESLLEDCLEVIRQEKKASTSLLQRRLRLGYGRAARMIDILEDRGIIGPQEGAKPREILVHMD
jgi:S-DNA-T family DNA segregation ATPase FtsK/SpoIIIE